MSNAKFCVFIFFLISLSNSSIAARYWVANVASNWNNAANWSNVSGGAGGFSVPGVADDVNFDNSGTGSCTIDAVVNVKSLNIDAGYNGNIIQGTSSLTTVNAALFTGGTFTGGTGNITIGGNFTLSGCAFTSTSGVLELRNITAAFTSATFTHNNGTVKLNSITGQTISGVSPVFYSLEVVGAGNTYTISSTGNITVLNSLNLTGTQLYTLNTGIIDVKGDINSSNTNTGCGGSGLININGTGVQNFNGSNTAGTGALPQLTINKASGALNLDNFPSVANNFTYIAGTINAGSSTFCFTRGSVSNYNITGTITLNNMAFIVSNTVTATIAAATTLNATGDFTLGGTGNAIINTGIINVNGNIFLTNTGSGGGGSATINIEGANNASIDGSTIIVNQSRLPRVNVNKPSGTLSLIGNISFSANVTYTAGTINPGTSTCYIVNNLTVTGSFSIYNLTISAAGNTNFTIAAGSTLTVTHDLDLESGAQFININTGTIAVQGNIINNNTNTTGGGSGTILINGTGAQSITSTGIIHQGRLPAITINKSLGTLTLPSVVTVRGNWNYISGTLDPLTNNSTIVFENTLSISGTHTLNHVTFDGGDNYTFTTAAGTTLNVTGTMNMTGTGNITLNTGTINLNGNLVLSNSAVGGGGSSVIAFVSGANQSISSALLINQNCLPAITINKPGGTLSLPALITVKGNWTYTSGTLDVTTNNSTVIFASPLGSGIFGITGNHSLNNVTFHGNNNNTATVNTGSILTVTGILSTTGSSNVFINTPLQGATAIQAQGDITINNTSVTGGGTGLILINGTGSQSFTSTASAGQGLMPYIKIQKPSGTLTLTGIISESRDWTYLSGAVDASTNLSTVVFGGNNLTITSAGMNFYHATVTSNTSTLANNLSVNGNLTINGTGVLSAGSNTINQSGNWINRGTAGFTEATGTVNFNGTSLQTITSPGGENFTNLIVNNTGAGIKLINSATIATNLAMTQGNIDLNSSTFTLGLSAANKGTLARTSGTMINTGSFIRWFNTTTISDGAVTGLFPMGTSIDYRPFYVSVPATGPTTGGTISASYTDANANSAVSFQDGAFTVVIRKDLNWALSTANGLAGGLYSLRADGTGLGTIGNTNDLRLTFVNSVAGSAGTNAGTTTNPQVKRTGLSLADLSNSFYIGSVNGMNTTLPITLMSFTATVEKGMVKLNWETGSESNNDYFTIQRSPNTTGWQDLKNITGRGNAGTNSFYAAYDETPYQGISYYRLKQTDGDGKQSYSFIRSINLETSGAVGIYPNPATDHIIITAGIGKVRINVYKSNGQLINVPAQVNANNVLLNVSGLEAGIYFIHVMQHGNKEIKMIVKR